MSFVYTTVLDDCQCSLVSTLQSTAPKEEKQFYSCLYQIKEKLTTPSSNNHKKENDDILQVLD